MRLSKNILLVAHFLFFLLTGQATAVTSGPWTIVVDCGRFSGVEAAAGAEGQIDWLDPDQSDDKTCTECFSAMELQRYLRRMTGRKDDFSLVDDDELPESGAVIVVGLASATGVRSLIDKLGIGAEQFAELGPQGYCIKSAVIDGRRLTLVAGQERVGTLYGAYDLLYRLGCRWFAPGDLHEEVPPLEAIPDLDVTARPSFVSRGFLAWEDRGDEDFLLWMARNRLNYWTLAQAAALP